MLDIDKQARPVPSLPPRALAQRISSCKTAGCYGTLKASVLIAVLAFVGKETILGSFVKKQKQKTIETFDSDCVPFP